MSYRLISAVRQFRHNTDNTGLVDRPEKGFVCAYDIGIVDAYVAELEARLAATQQRLAECERDVKRLDWMQFHGAAVCWSKDGEVCSVHWTDHNYEGQRTKNHGDWRAAIDKAMGRG